MGRILQIRVSAWTYDEEEVLQAWPKLCALVWSQLDQWGPAGMKRGVTELAGYLPDALRYFLRGRARAARKPGGARGDDPHATLLARMKPKNRKGRFN